VRRRAPGGGAPPGGGACTSAGGGGGAGLRGAGGGGAPPPDAARSARAARRIAFAAGRSLVAGLAIPFVITFEPRPVVAVVLLAAVVCASVLLDHAHVAWIHGRLRRAHPAPSVALPPGTDRRLRRERAGAGALAGGAAVLAVVLLGFAVNAELARAEISPLAVVARIVVGLAVVVLALLVLRAVMQGDELCRDDVLQGAVADASARVVMVADRAAVLVSVLVLVALGDPAAPFLVIAQVLPLVLVVVLSASWLGVLAGLTVGYLPPDRARRQLS
ncbi:MAG: hypothetical protein ACT4RN_06660, partial [Pseudonocardia sp.]